MENKMNEMNEQSNGVGKYVISFLAGMVTGSAIAYITAPRSGEETREQIRSRTAELQDTAEQTADEALESVRIAAKDISGSAEEFRSQSRTALDESKEQWAQAADEIRKSAMEAIEETRAAASEAIESSKSEPMTEPS
jgi:gas vesicle protein